MWLGLGLGLGLGIGLTRSFLALKVWLKKTTPLPVLGVLRLVMLVSLPQ